MGRMSSVLYHFKSTGIISLFLFARYYFSRFSILCLTALNKIDEASTLVTQLIEQYSQNADLLIIRARLYYKEKAKVSL